MWHEGTWWDADLIGVYAEDSDDLPPDMPPGQFGVATRKEGGDGKTWYVKERAGQMAWWPVDRPDWKPRKPGDDGVVYKLRLNPSGEVLSVVGLNKDFVNSELELVESLAQGKAIEHHLEPSYFAAMTQALDSALEEGGASTS